MNEGSIKIIRASAGAGKTYNLARTYIANLIGEPTGRTVEVEDKTYDTFVLRHEFNYHRHLLAITFTNKATNEMKDRIIKQLYLLSKGEGDYVDDFGIMFEENTLEEVITAARTALCAILFDYGNFNVSTIDSFFQRVLRNFARELDRDYNYELQIDEDYATGVAVHDFLLELGSSNRKQAAINEWVRQFIINNINNKRSWNFYGNSSDLQQFASIIYKEFFRDKHDEIINYLDDIGNGVELSKIARFKEKMSLAREIHHNAMMSSINKYHQFFADRNIDGSELKKNVITKFYDKSFTEFKKDEDTFRSYAAIPDALSTKVVKKAALGKLYSAVDDEAFLKLLLETLFHRNMCLLCDSILGNIWNLGLLGKIDEKLEQYRKDSNTILIADTNDLIGRALESGANFIYEHVGNQFSNYMIDEFQDTSKKQYSNFTPLLEESLARGKDNLVIGDEKQSIYRFRNSDPSLLRDVVESDFKGRISKSTLKTNFRSLQSIVDFNNTFFTNIIADYDKSPLRMESLIKTYSNIRQDKHKSGTGYVAVNFVPIIDKKESLTRESIIRTLPGLINSMLERGYQKSDIAVLVNTKDHGKEVIAQITRYNELQTDANRRIDVISSESLLLINSPSVKLILSALRFLEITHYQLPEDNDEALGEEFKRFLDGRVAEQRYYKILHEFLSQIHAGDSALGAGEILDSCVEKDHAARRDLSAREQIEKYASITQELMPDKVSQLSNIVNVVDRIISKYILTETKTELENSFILAFVDVVHKFACRHNGGTITEFLQYWDAESERLTLGSTSGINAVNVMTIHKSKGLEFKCVILPFANWKLDKMDSVFWIKKDQFVSQLGSSESFKDIDEDIVPPLVPINNDTLNKTGFFAPIYGEERERCIIDNINKLYVALTRPKEELHVFACIDSAEKMDCDKSVDSIVKSSDLLLKYVPAISIDGKTLTRTQRFIDMNYEPKSEVEAVEEEVGNKLEVITFDIGTLPVNSDDDRDKKAQVTKVRDYRVSTQVLPVHVATYEPRSAILDEGLRMHMIFGMINSVSDFDKVLNYAVNNDMLKGNSYWSLERLKSLFETIKSSELLCKWFDDANLCYNERNICFPSSSDGTKDRKRPDRIVKLPNGEVVVIDYKFGYRHSGEAVSMHKQQVGQYLHLMSQLGESNVKGYVWYTRSGTIVRVDHNK